MIHFSCSIFILQSPQPYTATIIRRKTEQQSYVLLSQACLELVRGWRGHTGRPARQKGTLSWRALNNRTLLVLSLPFFSKWLFDNACLRDIQGVRLPRFGKYGSFGGSGWSAQGFNKSWQASWVAVFANWRDPNEEHRYLWIEAKSWGKKQPSIVSEGWHYHRRHACLLSSGCLSALRRHYAQYLLCPKTEECLCQR